MSSSTVTLTPLTGSAVNNMILEYMALQGERRREELSRFLASGRTVPSDIMAMTLRGMILSASA